MTPTPTQTALIEMLVDILFDVLESHTDLAIRTGHHDIASEITNTVEKRKAQYKTVKEGASK